MEEKKSIILTTLIFFQKIRRHVGKLASIFIVEPYAILVFLAMQMYINFMGPGLYQVSCAKFNQENLKVGSSQIDCTRPKSQSIRDQNLIQQNLSNWAVLMALSHFLPSILSTCLFGAWGDSSGRKPTFLLSLAGIVVSTAATPFFFYNTGWSLWFLALINFLGGCLGYIVILTISAYLYLCDTVLDKDILSIRLASFSACMTIAGIFGSLLSGALLGKISLAWLCLIITSLLTLAFFYVFWRLEDLTPKEIRLKLLSEGQYEANGLKQKKPRRTPKSNEHRRTLKTKNPRQIFEPKETPQIPDFKDTQRTAESFKNSRTPIDKISPKTPEKITFCQKCRKIVKAGWDLFIEIYHTYTKPRQGHERSILVVTSVLLYLYLMADLGLMQSIMNHYVIRHPFYWTSGSELGYWKAAKGLSVLLGNVFGMLFFKRCLKLRDTTIMLISSVSCASELIFIAFSTAGWMLYVALLLGCFTNLLMPVMGSLISRIVGYDEIGKAFTAHGLASNLAFLTSALIFNGVYKATLNFMPGFVFLFGAFIISVCFCIIFWIHVKEAECYNTGGTINREDGAAAAQ